jgi:FxsC-like protein
MARGFFFSYARINRDDYLNQFYADLCKEAALKDYWPGGEFGFFDTESIETGTMWKPELEKALGSSRVLVAICSPQYINSPYCGKEFQVFHERHQDFVSRYKPQKGPRFIFPVIWGHPSGSLHETIKLYQLANDALGGSKFPDAYMENGLHNLMSLVRYKDDYTMFVTHLAHQIVDAAKEQDLDDLADVRPLDQVKNAFAAESAEEVPEGSRAFFVFVAGKPTELVNKVRSVDRYRLQGGGDWRPFFPKTDTMTYLGSDSVRSQSLHYREKPADGTLMKLIEDANRTKEIVVIVVDPWTLRLSSYQDLMKEYDAKNFNNCALLVSWCGDGSETEEELEELRQLVGETFEYKKSLKRLIPYRDDIRSIAALKVELAKILANWKKKYIASIPNPVQINNDEVEKDAQHTGRKLDRLAIVAGPGGERR